MSLVTGLARYIGANVVGLDWSLADGGNVFEDHQPADPDLSVTVYSTGGPEPQLAHTSNEQRAQLVFRAEPEAATGATDLWWAVFHVIHGLRRVELPDGTKLAWLIVVNGAPVSMGTDENGRMEFSMNVRAEVIQEET